MANLTIQGKYMLGILDKIKEYPDYKKHLPVITSGIDVYTEYIDYYLTYDNNKTADVLFIQTVMPLPGSMGNLDYTLIILDLNTITITYDKEYYDFDPTDISTVETIGFNIAELYKNLLRIMEYGYLHWGVPFRKYSIRINNANYNSGIINLNCDNDQVFYIQSNIFTPSSMKPISVGTLATPYEDIKAIYIPTMYLNAVGAQLGIYPDSLLESFNNLLHQRKLFRFPLHWMSANARRKILMPPYAKSQIVFSETSLKSFISMKDNNIDNPDENTESWKVIDYTHPLDTSNISSLPENPLETLLGCFNKSFDLSTLSPN
jgi:hypothetical protein